MGVSIGVMAPETQRRMRHAGIGIFAYGSQQALVHCQSLM
jgi:hypothetical protein